MNFIEQIIQQDIASDVHEGRVATRFPPEPNGYLHIGHAKSICLNFGLAEKYQGTVNLRFDDTNPEKEDTRYVEGIREDIRWLGFSWQREHFASDYFEQLYGLAVRLIENGLAYVDDSSPEEIAAGKGTPTVPGTATAYRDRPVAENLRLFAAMRAGKFAEGEKVLRAKIDLASPNMHMRDPVMYRIKYAPHHRTGTSWCIYPLYDFAHGQSDAFEQITHSTCTLEFVAHRPLYDWFISRLGLFPSRQIEFARLNLTYTVMSKRKLLHLITNGQVTGWDDPRLPTIAGLRRRGYTASSIRVFCDRIGVARRDSVIDLALLEFCIREELNRTAPRRTAVIHPMKVVLTNYPEDYTEYLPFDDAPGTGNDPATRLVPLTREIWIEQDDFREVAGKDFYRLTPGGMVRLKGAYIIRCDRVIKDPGGNILEVRCTFFPDSRSGHDVSNLKVKATIHWLSADHAVQAEIRLYDRLFEIEEPENGAGEFTEYLNPASIQVLERAFIEPELAIKPADSAYQFIRLGYFIKDPDSTPGKPVFNRTVRLKEG